MRYRVLTGQVRQIKWIALGILLVVTTHLAVLINDVKERRWQDRFRSSWVEYAKDLSHRRDWEGLLAHTTEWVAENPKEPYALFYHAIALFRLERWQEAQEIFEQLKTLAPSWTETINQYVAVCAEKIETEETPSQNESSDVD
jgi:tetratricopeptide (TPR) repeat protein